ncbi:hypothetical protein [Actinoplanes auranticolor]|uniref:Lipase (Class 3) n=1 Tax=Actinoplanes auranticolor TaxID=47988 RepID=A0A919SJI9_9ACTN|nr:hypothetical protein [Actinoplanes auranticolor]GIM73920.1 hypothetical protein Aau02nite_58280 [Actinoplanes auranticolor]
MVPQPHDRDVENRVVEIRVHGVSGTPIESVLDDPWPAQVAGDDAGRIFRRSGAHPSGRVIEGYHWGRYTAGSPSRALWLLLVPFALVNVARFALLMPERRRTRDGVADGVIRLLGLVLTVTIVVTTCYLGWNVLARQCGPGACSGGFGPLDWYAGRSPGVRELVGALLPITVLVVFWQFDRLSFPHDPPGVARRQRRGSNGDLGDPGFWRGASAQTSWQRAAHVWTGCAVAGLLALAMLGRPGVWAGQHAVFTVACALVAAVLTAGLVSGVWQVIRNPMPKETEAVPDGRDPVALRPGMRAMRLSTAAAALAAVGLAAIGLDHVTPAAPQEVGAIFSAVANGVFALLGAVLLVLLGVCALLAYGSGGRRLRLGDGDRPTIPVSFRPFYFGMAGWLGAALGATAGMGMSAAAVFWTARALGDPVVDGTRTQPQQIEIAAVYWIMAAVWGALAVVLVVALLPLAAWLLRRRMWWLLVPALLAAGGTAAWAVLAHPGPDVLSRQAEWLIVGLVLVLAVAFVVFFTGRDSFRRLLSEDYTDNEKLIRAQARVAGRWRIAMIRYRYHHVLGLLATLGGLAVIVSAGACAWLLAASDEPPRALMGNATGPLGQLGVVVVSFGATGLVVLGLGTWRRAGLRTTVGVIWDLLSFWPRVGHPLCPPPYGGRAVLALAGRASQWANRGVPKGARADQVVLSGHSQGSVITLAACAVILDQAAGKAGERGAEDDLNFARSRVTAERLHMITYGSQLQFLYARFFPSYLGFARISEVCTAGLRRRWLNAFRWTDPLGGPVLSWQVPKAGEKFGPDLTEWLTMGCDPACTEHRPVVRCGCTDPCPSRRRPAGECPEPRYWAIGADVRLRDPATIVDSPDVPRLAARGHSGYLSDPAYEVLLQDLLDGALGLPGTAECRRPAVRGPSPAPVS